MAAISRCIASRVLVRLFVSCYHPLRSVLLDTTAGGRSFLQSSSKTPAIRLLVLYSLAATGGRYERLFMSVLNQPKATILVVDDDTAVRSGLRWLLDERYRVLEAGSRGEAVELMRREKIDAVL